MAFGVGRKIKKIIGGALGGALGGLGKLLAGKQKSDTQQQNLIEAQKRQQDKILKGKQEKQAKIRQGQFRASAGRRAGRRSLFYDESALGSQTKLGA